MISAAATPPPLIGDSFEGSNNLVSTTALPIDPLFVDLRTYADIAGDDGQLNTADDGPLGDYRLLDDSPAINTGSNLYLDETDSDGTGPDLEIDLNASGTIGDYILDSDLAGQPRVIGSAVDIGAYESQNTTELDFGDAPAPYATTLLANGARHVAAGPMLGSVRDGEADGVPSTDADADDTTGTTDDEDGVTFGTIQVGQLSATVTVNVQYAPAGAKLDAWIDFNGDGCWGGPLEQIADNVSVVEGNNTITFDVPSWALSGETYARFRLSTSGDLAPTGTASDGEVEDYRLSVTPPGKGSGTFVPCEPLATSQLGAEAVFAADMDGDGDTDVLATFLDGTIAWYENAGNLDFRVHTIPSSVDEPVSVHAADLDGDGDMDVLSASSGDDTIAWYENDGNGNFSTHTITTAADGARSVFAADIDGDGIMDVLSASANDDTIAWYRNDGDANFTAHTITTAADGAWSVHAVDLDADGDVDVLSASWNDDTIAWYENDGNGNFTIHTITSSADRATSVFVADVNGDGHLDVLSGAYSQITWYQNDGNQVFAAHEIPHSATGVRCVYAADVDGDGDTDVLSASDAGEMLWWYENDGSEVFTPRYVFDTTERARAILAADVDGDGDADILATLSGGSRVWGEGKVNCYENNGNQGFTPYDIATPAPSVLSVFAADMDGDGDMDALSASLRNDRITWYENDGQDFTAHTVTRSANGAACVVAVDVDGDGDMDVLAASRLDDTIAWYENDGQEEFIPHVVTTSASADWPGSLLAADMDGDGDMDVVAANYYEDNVTWYENQGGEGFAAHVIISGMAEAICVYAADVDGDGDMDVLSASNGDDTVAWYENNGSQGFTAHTISASADGTQSVCAADLDGDGDLDVVSNNFDEILWYENDGTGSFVTRSIPSGGDSVSNLVAADMDGDGDMDLLATFVSRDTLSWYENQGNASFTRHDITTTADGTISVFAADMDGDGDLDAILASSYDNTVAWYENLSPDFTVAESGSSTTVSESGVSDTFTVALDVAPASNVVISVSSSAPGEVALTPATLTFTPENWNTPQTVAVSAVDDSIVDGTRTTTVTLSIVDAQSDDAFDGLPDKTLSVTSIDNDVAGFTVTETENDTTVSETGAGDTFDVVLNAAPLSDVSLTITILDTDEVTTDKTTLLFTPENWNTPQTVTLSGVNDYRIDGDQVTTITISIDQAASDDAFDALADQTVTVTTTDDNVAGFSVSHTDGDTTVSEDGTTDTFSVMLDVAPSSNVVILVSSSDLGEVTVATTSLTFTPTNWNIPQSVTVTGVDDPIADGSQTTEITFSIDDPNSDNDFDALDNQILTVTTIDNESVGFTVTESDNSTAVSESGATDTFAVALTIAPLSNVVLFVTCDDLGEATVDQASLTFTPSNWHIPQTVTVTGMDDFVLDGLQSTTVTLAVDTASSHDAFDGVEGQTVLVTTEDDDFATLTVLHTDDATVVDESGTSDTFTVVLDAEPASDVVLLVTSGDPDEAGTDVTSLTFTPSNWNEPQEVNVTGIDDVFVDGSQASVIVLSVDAANSDDAFDSLSDTTVPVTTTDDDVAGYVVEQTQDSTQVSEFATTDTLTVVLTAAPLSNVVITVASGDTDEATVDRTQLTFTPSNWNEPQVVTVTGVDDTVIDGDQTTTITLSIDDSNSDDAFDSLADQTVLVTTTDNDDVGLVVTEPAGGLSVTEGGTTAQFTVALDTQPGVNVVVLVTSGDKSEAIVSVASLTFTPDNWDVAQTVTVMGKDDLVMDGDQTTTITLAIDDANSDDAFDDVPDTAVLVTTTDNDSAGVLVNASELATSEAGGTATFTIVLRTEPAADVTVAFSSNDLTEGDITSLPLTFTAGNWYTPQAVTITGLDDHLLDGDVAYTITADFSSDDPGYDEYQLDALTVTNIDDDEAGITVTPTTGLTTSESGDSASFTVVLQSEPTADVTITITGDATEGEISPATLTFSVNNWNEPQGVTITGLDDSIADGNVTYTLLTDVSSGDSDYNDYQLPALTVTNVDDDDPGITITPTAGLTTSESGDSASFTVVLQSEPTADVTITVTGDATEGEVSPATLTFSANNWNEPQGVTVTGIDDHVADGNVTYTLLTDVSSGDSDYNDYQLPALTVTNVDDDEPGITVTPTTGLSTSETGDSASFTVVLRSEPTADVTITVTGDATEGEVSPATLTFSANNWNEPQGVTVTGIDDHVADGNVTYTLLTDVSSGDSDYNDYQLPALTVTNVDDDEPGITVTPTTGLSTSETGDSASFTVVLQSEPTADVTITVTGDAAEGEISPTTLTFSANNWNEPQGVTITGVDDFIADGNVTYTLLTDVSSGDSDYNDYQLPALTVTNVDDDDPGITVSPTTGLTTSELGASASFTVVLRSEPTADVTITVTGDATEGEVSPATLTFSANNWNEPQGVTVTGIDDHVADGNVTYTLLTDVSSGDSDYNDYQLPALTVTNVDDDDPGITVTPTTGLTTSELGDSASFTVVLRSEPTADVTITVTGDATEGEVSPTTLTFSANNWNEPQGVTVTGVDDHVADGNVTYTLLTDVSSGDSDYNDYQLPALTVTNVDDDEPGITVTPTTGLTTSEAGDSAYFTVVLKSEPTADVTITVTCDATEGEVSPTTLTFSANNWNEPQGVTVTGVDDHVADGNVTYTLLTDVSSGDSDYNDYQLPALTVTNVDDDEPGITVTPTTGLSTSETGDSASFTVVLQSEPTADVTITVTGDAAEGEISPATLTFSANNWNEPQGVTVTGVDDHVADGNVTYTLLTDVSSGDSDYNDYQLPALTVTNVDDDDPGITVTPTTGLTTSEAGDSAYFTVVLKSEPTADVTITVTCNATEGEVSPATLTFSANNWNEPQGFTITGVDDHVADGNITYTLLTDVSSGDSDYNDYQLPSLTVTNVDDDEPGITVTPTTGLITSENGDTASFTVVLQSEPTADVTIPISTTNDAEATASPVTLTFTPVNWDTPQAVTVTGVDDDVDDGDVSSMVVIGAAVSDDLAYNGWDADDIQVTNEDNDEEFVPEDLGQADFRRLESLAPTGQELWFQLETTHDGWLTVVADAEWTADQLSFALYDPGDLAAPLAVADASQVAPRFDYAVGQGNVLLLQVTGTTSEATLLLANLVNEVGTAITVFGTADADVLTFDAAASREITINDVVYHYEDSEVATVDFDGGEGRDTVWLYDSTGNESLEAWPDHASFVNGSGDDVADFAVQVSGIEDLLAYATRGGTDDAVFHGSADGDKFKSYEDSVRLRARNSSYTLRAKKFDTVLGDAGSGGKDIAVFNGSDGEDTFHFSGAENAAQMEGKRRDHTATGFGSIVVRAGSGENDVAYLTDFPGPDSGIDDVVYFRAHKTQLVGEEVEVIVRAFDVVHATASESGFDVARIYDTSGDDHLEVDGDTVRLYRRSGSELDLLYEAIGFERVKAYSTAGDDTTDIGEHDFDLLLNGWDE